MYKRLSGSEMWLIGEKKKPTHVWLGSSYQRWELYCALPTDRDTKIEAVYLVCAALWCRISISPKQTIFESVLNLCLSKRQRACWWLGTTFWGRGGSLSDHEYCVVSAAVDGPLVLVGDATEFLSISALLLVVSRYRLINCVCAKCCWQRSFATAGWCKLCLNNCRCAWKICVCCFSVAAWTSCIPMDQLCEMLFLSLLWASQYLGGLFLHILNKFRWRAETQNKIVYIVGNFQGRQNPAWLQQSPNCWLSVVYCLIMGMEET